jgi:hypothetical protein
VFFSSTESENISNTSTTDSQTTEDDKTLERLLETVEDCVKDMELTSERDGIKWTWLRLAQADQRLM